MLVSLTWGTCILSEGGIYDLSEGSTYGLGEGVLTVLVRGYLGPWWGDTYGLGEGGGGGGGGGSIYGLSEGGGLTALVRGYLRPWWGGTYGLIEGVQQQHRQHRSRDHWQHVWLHAPDVYELRVSRQAESSHVLHNTRQGSGVGNTAWPRTAQ